MQNKRIILDLCGGTGAWSEPYRQRSDLYDVWLVTLPEYDVRTFEPPEDVWGVLAAPPCTEFSRAGARWWPEKPTWLLEHAIETVEACLALVRTTAPRWWVLENPIGRIGQCVPALGGPKLKCDPCDYGDAWTKRMWLWGNFTVPRRTPVEPQWAPHRVHIPRHRDRTSMLSSSARVERSRTSAAFARAFFEANP